MLESDERKGLRQFVAPTFAELLKRHQLDTFDRFWQHAVDWFEPPNERRGGWSGVGRIEMKSPTGESVQMFVKKQQNHGRRTLRHPIVGEPTFRREFKRLKYLEQHGFSAPKAVFYGEAVQGRNQTAILVTQALSDFVPLDMLETTWNSDASCAQKRVLISTVAQAIRRFHRLGLVHRALYPKHIFVSDADTSPEVAVIDLEKARVSYLPMYRTFFDLSALNRHAVGWRRTQRMRFLLSYWGVSRLNFVQKQLCRIMLARSAR